MAGERHRRRPLIVAGIILGVGLGGFLDGIVLHQVLQWHHMLTSAGYPATSVENLEINTLADGLFHAATWLMTAIGLALLWRAGRLPDVPWSTTTFIGSMLIGWGGFNLVEGIIDHHILGIHHVKPGPNQFAWDLAFLPLGALLATSGWALIRGAEPETSLAAVSDATRAVPDSDHAS